MNLTHFLPWSLLLLVHSVLSAPSRTCRERSIKHQDRCEDNALLQRLDPVDQPDNTNRKLAESFCSSYFAGPAVVRPVHTSQVTTVTPPPAVSPKPMAKPPVVRVGGHHLFEDEDDSDDGERDMTTITVTITTTRTVTRTIMPTTTVTTTQVPAISVRALPRLSRQRRRAVARAPPMMEYCPRPWRGQPEDQIRRACECLVGREKGTVVGARAEEATAVVTAPEPVPDVTTFNRSSQWE
ncbi:hypothetical protein QBC45DRAFT_391757 [Copromyces sp. CBS 386.78]|nr:hypothetical protein QBC45DRAFT_391757 [Copromyces sp. CBS 386.78]